MKDQSKVIAALLIGAAAGAALGLLLAPEKGEDIRDGVVDYISELIDAAKEKAQSAKDDLVDYGTNVYEKAKSKVSGLADETSNYKDSAVDAVKAKGKEFQGDAEGKYADAKSKFKGNANDVNNSIQNA